MNTADIRKLADSELYEKDRQVWLALADVVEAAKTLTVTSDGVGFVNGRVMEAALARLEALGCDVKPAPWTCTKHRDITFPKGPCPQCVAEDAALARLEALKP